MDDLLASEAAAVLAGVCCRDCRHLRYATSYSPPQCTVDVVIMSSGWWGDYGAATSNYPRELAHLNLDRYGCERFARRARR